MRSAVAKHGTYAPIYWDGDGMPSAFYVNGHVTDAEFRDIVERWHGPPFAVDADATIERIYIRMVRSSSSDFDHEIRHCAKGRGAKPMTVWTVSPHRGEGA